MLVIKIQQKKNSKSKQDSINPEEKIDLKLIKRNQKRIQKKINKQKIIERYLKLESFPKSQLPPLHGSLHTDIADAIPITFADYLDLVEATGHCIRDDKLSFIFGNFQKIIRALDLNPELWITHIKNFSSMYAVNVGSKKALNAKSEKDNKRWYKGVGFVS